ncbi:MAG: hypothetical protein OXE92_05265 [Bacteroidetes bacterium]|nr:hypothetical protein [Bacteroidota bacterium]
MFTINRTVSQVKLSEDEHFEQDPQPLCNLDVNRGYVLLGEPGMGKTTEFSKEADRAGGLLIPVSHFINRNPESTSQWRNKLLFLDGLDEARTGGGTSRDVISKVVAHIEALGIPRFCLSCRSSSWLGVHDHDELLSLLPDTTIPVFQLNPLSYNDAKEIIKNYRNDPEHFIQQAHQYDMEAFLWNPQLLSILLESVRIGGWSENLTQIFENACMGLLNEPNSESDLHSSLDLLSPQNHSLLHAAGLLSALLLIAHKGGCSLDDPEDFEFLSLQDIKGENHLTLRSILDSEFFKGNHTSRIYRHRLLAEFLAARYLHEKIEDGLSVQRTIALLMGQDGNLFPDLRGVTAWLASLNPIARPILIQSDPVAMAFDGDASNLSIDERRKLLLCLENKVDFPFIWSTSPSPGGLADGQGIALIEELTSSPIHSNNKQSWGEPLSNHDLEQTERVSSDLRQRNRRRVSHSSPPKREDSEWKRNHEKHQAFFHERRKKELERIRQHKSELAKGRCSPALLDQLARIYFSISSKQDNHPRNQLISYMDGDESLVRATLSGFRNLLDRDDLPDLDQIAELHETNQRSYFARPFLAGILEQEYEAGTALNRLNEKGLRRALGFFLVTDISHRPPWLEHALKCAPEAIADALVAIHNACVRAKLSPNEYLLKLVNDPTYAPVAQLAVNRMFTAFPTRCSGSQLDSLRMVLWSAALAGSISKAELHKIVLKRLKRKKMDIRQRAYWLCAGLFVARDQCLPLLVDFLSLKGEIRIRHIFDFLVMSGTREFIFKNMTGWKPEELFSIIQAIGKQGQSYVFQDGPYLLGNNQKPRDALSPITPWVEELGKRSDDKAMSALALLTTDPDLAIWKQELQQAQKAQAFRYRMNMRPSLGVEQIQRTLKNGPPANAADLFGLITDILEEISHRIRNEQTDDWLQYWYCDPKTKKPVHPRSGNECRDALLLNLQEILHRYDIDAQPEGQYSENKRANIRLSYKSHIEVPIEIRKNSHSKIWHGISKRLVPKYTRDPNTDSYGVYLVLWFGANEKYMKMLSAHGGVPSKPEELKSMLAEQLHPSLKKRVRIAIIDVSLRGRYAEDENNLFESDCKLLSSFSDPACIPS